MRFGWQHICGTRPFDFAQGRLFAQTRAKNDKLRTRKRWQPPAL